jgi:hypothetical protein
VGALKPDNYGSCLAWIDCTPIDLCSRHPSIQEQDFLLMDKVEHCGRWGLISLSLVLNFVPDPKTRGEMARRPWGHYLYTGHDGRRSHATVSPRYAFSCGLAVSCRELYSVRSFELFMDAWTPTVTPVMCTELTLPDSRAPQSTPQACGLC